MKIKKEWIYLGIVCAVAIFCIFFEDQITYITYSSLDKLLSIYFITSDGSRVPIGSMTFCLGCGILGIYILYLTVKEITNNNKKK